MSGGGGSGNALMTAGLIGLATVATIATAGAASPALLAVAGAGAGAAAAGGAAMTSNEAKSAARAATAKTNNLLNSRKEISRPTLGMNSQNARMDALKALQNRSGRASTLLTTQPGAGNTFGG